MEYLLLIYSDPALQPATPEDEAAQFQEYAEFTRWLQGSGLMKGGDPLLPTSDATTIRERDGQRTVTDGPFAETKEWLAGYYLIEAPDLDTAIDAAQRCPGTREGAVEVRPVFAWEGGTGPDTAMGGT